MKTSNFIILASLFVANGAFASSRADSMAVSLVSKYDCLPDNMDATDSGKSMISLRQYFMKNAYRSFSDTDEMFRKDMTGLCEDGRFSDLRDEDAGIPLGGNQADSGGSITIAYNRIWRISEAFRCGKLSFEHDRDIMLRLLKSVLHYGGLEILRPNDESRFHASCFGIPTSAVNTYFCLLPGREYLKDNAEKELFDRAFVMLKANALQAWTQPYRRDKTDNDVTMIERFRHHVWWVGGNALAYRPLLPVAVMLNSVRMMDTLIEVCHRGISQTSQTTNKESFWNEGFTADGAGWGHGKQCLIWGYPIDGTMNALNILSLVNGTVWDKPLGREQADALLDYFRGANFYYYKGYIPPCLDRNSMNFKQKPSPIRYERMISMLLKHWKSSFTASEVRELEDLYSDLKDFDISMNGDTRYNGIRCFFNNDDMIKKTPDYHLFVNMASSKCDGIESADGFADGYNFFTNDGLTLFQKDGTEYNKAIGAADITMLPGITAREGMEHLESITNWRGFSSKHRFGGSAADGSNYGAAGFIFEKLDSSSKPGVNDKGNGHGKNEGIFGVKAYKSYFILNDYLVCLGAGITNLRPNLEGDIRTSIEQTEWTDSVYEEKIGDTRWIVQDNKFSYSVVPGYEDVIRYSCEEKNTEWVKRNIANKGRKELPQKVRLFSIWINHGRKPVDDKYGYVVYLGDGKPASKVPFKVVCNDKKIQAVASADSKVVAAVIYDSNSTLHIDGGTDISVSAPCVLLLQDEGERIRVDISDPLMDKETKYITVKAGGRKISCRMPDGKEKGKPCTFYLK